MDQIAVEAAPESVSDFLERLDSLSEALPKRLQQCASFTRRHLHLIAVSTVSDMARASGVAPSAYMRFCQALGFSGYSEFQALFRAQYADFRPDYESRLAGLHDTGAVGPDRLLADFAEAGHKSLLSLGNTVHSQDFEAVAQGLAAARVVHLLGYRRAFAVVSNMAYLMQNLGIPVVLHGGVGLLGSPIAAQPGDAMFAVTFAPFSRETLDQAQACAARGVPLFALSDTEDCPLADTARHMLLARESEVGGFRSLTASIALTSALSVAVSAARQRG